MVKILKKYFYSNLQKVFVKGKISLLKMSPNTLQVVFVCELHFFVLYNVTCAIKTQRDDKHIGYLYNDIKFM